MPDDPALLATAWFEAWRTTDAGAIERMMAAQYVYVAPNGAVMAREAILAIASDPSYRITDGAHTEVEVIPLGVDVAVVRHRWRGHGTLRGQVFVDDHRCVMIWHRAEGLWRDLFTPAGRPSRNRNAMKKTPSRGRKKAGSNGPRGEYEFDYSRSRFNRFASKLGPKTVAVVLEPDVAQVFDSSRAVNKLLRSVIAATPGSDPAPRSRRKAG